MNRFALVLSLAAVVGCNGGNASDAGSPVSSSAITVNKSEKSPADFFVLTVLYSEYPSWGAFAAASDLGLIDGRSGWVGPIEKKHGVDIDLRLRSYDVCMTEYGSSGGAVCITNTDIVGLVKGQPSTAILPTSTSFGADAITVIGVNSLDELKAIPVYGLEKSVSDFAFTRIIEKAGKNPADFKFTNRDPEAGAQALQATRIQAAMLWNPFIIQTLKTQPKSKVLADTTSIPGEVIDMVVMDNKTLAQPKGRAAAQCVVDTYYAVCGLLRDPKASEDAFASLKDKFAPNLTTDDMRSICQLGESGEKGYKTKFYDTPELGLGVFEFEHLNPIMNEVKKWAKARQTIDDSVDIKLGLFATLKGNLDPHLQFSTTFMTAAGK